MRKLWLEIKFCAIFYYGIWKFDRAYKKLKKKGFKID